MDVEDGPHPWRTALRRIPEWNALPGRVRRQLITGRRFPHERAEAEAALAYAHRTETLGGAFVVALIGALAGAAGWLVSAAIFGRGLREASAGAVTFAVTWLVVGTLLGRRRARRLAERAAWALEDDDQRRPS